MIEDQAEEGIRAVRIFDLRQWLKKDRTKLKKGYGPFESESEVLAEERIRAVEISDLCVSRETSL